MEHMSDLNDELLRILGTITTCPITYYNLKSTKRYSDQHEKNPYSATQN